MFDVRALQALVEEQTKERDLLVKEVLNLKQNGVMLAQRLEKSEVSHRDSVEKLFKVEKELHARAEAEQAKLQELSVCTQHEVTNLQQRQTLLEGRVATLGGMDRANPQGELREPVVGVKGRTLGKSDREEVLEETNRVLEIIGVEEEGGEVNPQQFVHPSVGFPKSSHTRVQISPIEVNSSPQPHSLSPVEPLLQELARTARKPSFSGKQEDWFTFVSDWEGYWSQVTIGRSIDELTKFRVFESCLDETTRRELALGQKLGRTNTFVRVFTMFEQRHGGNRQSFLRRDLDDLQMCLSGGSRHFLSGWLYVKVQNPRV